MLAIRAARLFDGIGPDHVANPLVLVEDGRVVAVESGAEPPTDAELLDLGDVTLLPGLVDSHTHLALDGTDDAVANLTGADDAALLDRMRVAARQTLAAGVTTVRDLGDRGYLALRLRDEAAGPEILAAGPPITTSGGHCWFLGGEVTGVEGVRQAVRERAGRGVDVIKIMATGGGITEGSLMWEQQFSRAELRAAVDEAHRLGLPITAHAHSPAAIAEVVAAGFDGIEHCTFYGADGIQVDRTLVRRMAGDRLAVSLTLGAVPGTPLTDEQKKQIPAFVAGLAVMRDAGVNLLCGSDSGIFSAKPHGGFANSVEAMVTMAGLGPAEALRSATSRPARVLGLGERKGQIATGFDADMVAVGNDPLLDPAALHDVRAVFRAGSLIDGGRG